MGKISVLLAENVHFESGMVQKILGNGFSIEKVRTSYEALRAIRYMTSDKTPLRVVVTDLFLESGPSDGVFLVGAIRGRNPKIPIVIWTAQPPGSSYVKAALSAGANAVVYKGSTGENLRNKVLEIIL
ncbi:MAG: response regulator [Minisyncoccia bacterium]